ncbi:MAG: hypothetical protein R3F14_29535 [Polyangiaceae bacterium]
MSEGTRADAAQARGAMGLVARLRSPALVRFAKDPSARLGAVLLGAIVLFALVGPWVIPHDPLASDFRCGAM